MIMGGKRTCDICDTPPSYCVCFAMAKSLVSRRLPVLLGHSIPNPQEGWW